MSIRPSEGQSAFEQQMKDIAAKTAHMVQPRKNTDHLPFKGFRLADEPTEEMLTDPEGQRLVQAIHDRKRLEEITHYADTEAILRNGDPFYGDDGEASQWDRNVTPAVVTGLCEEITRLRAALAGHLFDGESIGAREAIRSEMIAESQRYIASAKADGVRLAARNYPSMLRDIVSRGSVIGWLTIFADNLEQDLVTEAQEDQEQDPLRRHPTYANCATCDGGGCGDCA